MSDVQPYSPGSTGTLSDVIERGPELAPFTPAGPDGFKPAPSFGELFSAARPAQLQAQPLYDDVKLRDYYAPIVDALGLPDSENPAAFGDPGSFGALAAEARYGLPVTAPSRLATSAGLGDPSPFSSNRYADRPLQEELIVQRIRQARLKDPNAFPGVPDTVEGIHAAAEAQQAAQRAAGATVLARGSFFGRNAAGLAAGAVEGAVDNPITVPSLLIGGGTAPSLVQAVARDALINGVFAAANLPGEAHNMAEDGEHLTAGEAIGQVATSAVIGAGLGAVVHVGAHAVAPVLTESLFKAMPQSVQTRWAGRMKVGENGPLLSDVLGDMDNRELSTFSRSTIGPHMTPDETAAANTLERSQELGEGSPFMPGPQGDAAHNASLADALKAMVDRAGGQEPLTAGTSLGSGVTAPALGPFDTSRAAVPHDIVDFLRSKGLDDAHAYGIAAGIVAESGGDHTALNRQSGAFGLGQWLGERKAKLIERYGPNPSREQQLEYLWGELSGGDPGGKFVLGAKDPGSVLDAYVRRFMRPGAAGTLGDLERGMASLGKKGELPEAGAGVGAQSGGDDALASLRSEADDAENEAERMSAERDRADEADLSRAAPPLDAADYPILRRELFPDDSSWFDAQLGFYRSQGLLPDAAEEAATAPRGSERDAAAPAQPGTAGGAPDASEGPFGPKIAPAADWQATLAALREAKTGVVPGALDHPDIGPIDLPYGDAGTGKSDGYGLAKLEKFHPEVVAELPDIVRSMKVVSETDSRIQLESADHKGAVSLEWMGEPTDQWLLTAFAKDAEHLPKTAPALPEDRRGSAPGAPDDRRGAPDGRNGSSGLGAVSNISDAGPIDNAALKAFDAPANAGQSEGAKASVASLEHDARMAAADPELAKRAYDLDESGKPRTIAQILDEIDRDRKAAAALRACAGGGE